MLLPAVAAALGGCRKERQEAVTLSVNPAGPIVYEAEGGTTKVTVTTNQKTWDVHVAQNQKWCTVEQVDGSGFVVKASVNRNREAERRTKITVTAGIGKDANRVVLEVSQRKAKAPFEITLSDITDTSVRIKVVPLDSDGTYFFTAIEQATLELFGGIPEFMEELVAFAANWYGSLDTALKVLTHKGEAEEVCKELAPDNECVAFAVGLDEMGKLSTEVIEVKFRTEKEKGSKRSAGGELPECGKHSSGGVFDRTLPAGSAAVSESVSFAAESVIGRAFRSYIAPLSERVYWECTQQ